MYKRQGEEIGYDFPRITWTEAMDTYGSDKPDLRFGLPIVDLTDLAGRCSFSVFRKVCDNGGVVRAVNAKGCAGFSRTQIEMLTKQAISYGAKGMAWIAYRPDGEIYSILTKYLEEEEIRKILERLDAVPGDFVLFCADKKDVYKRQLLARRRLEPRCSGRLDPLCGWQLLRWQYIFCHPFPPQP